MTGLWRDIGEIFELLENKLRIRCDVKKIVNDMRINKVKRLKKVLKKLHLSWKHSEIEYKIVKIKNCDADPMEFLKI